MLNRLNGALLPDRPRLSPAPSPSRVFKGVPLSSYSVTKVSLRPPLGRCQAATQDQPVLLKPQSPGPAPPSDPGRKSTFLVALAAAAAGLLTATLIACGTIPSPVPQAHSPALPTAAGTARPNRSRDRGKAQPDGAETSKVNPIAMAFKAFRDLVPEHKAAAAAAAAATPILLTLILVPRLTSSLRRSSTHATAPMDAHSSSPAPANGSLSTDNLSTLTTSLRAVTARTQSMLERVEDNGSKPSAVPAQGRSAGAGQPLRTSPRGSSPSPPPASHGWQDAAGPGTQGEAARRTAIPPVGEVDESAEGVQGELGVCAQQQSAAAAAVGVAVSPYWEPLPGQGFKSWASRAQLRGSGCVLPDDAPKLVPVMGADGSLVFTREQLTAPTSASIEELGWKRDDQTTLAEEIQQWSAIIQRGSQREAAETLRASVDLAQAVLSVVDKSKDKLKDSPNPSSNSSSEGRGTVGLVSFRSSSSSIGSKGGEEAGAARAVGISSRDDARSTPDQELQVPEGFSGATMLGQRHGEVAQLVDFMAGLPEQLEARERLLQQQQLTSGQAQPAGTHAAEPSLGNAQLRPAVLGDGATASQEWRGRARGMLSAPSDSLAAEQDAAIASRVQAAADAVRVDGMLAWVSAVARQREEARQAAAELEAALADKEAALAVLVQHTLAMQAEAARLAVLAGERMAEAAEEAAHLKELAAAAAEEEARQAAAAAALLQRQQAYRAKLEAEWAERRATWNAREVAEREQQRLQAIRNEELYKEAVAKAQAAAEARRAKEAAERAAAEEVAREEARAAEAAARAAEEALRAREQAEREAEETRQAVAAQRAALAAQAQAAAEAEAELRAATERAAAAAARALEEQEAAARDAQRREREVVEAQASAARLLREAEEECTAARQALAVEAEWYARQVASAAALQGAVAQQAVMAAQAAAAAKRQELRERREAALARLEAKEQQRQEAVQAQTQRTASDAALAEEPAYWALYRAQVNESVSKYSPLMQLADGGGSVGQWQGVAYEVLALEGVVGTELPRYSPLEVMTAAHPVWFAAAYQEFERMQEQPRRLAKVHPAIAAWIMAAAKTATAQNRYAEVPAWKLSPVWAELRGPRNQALLEAAMEAWPLFERELEFRHRRLHDLACKGTQVRSWLERQAKHDDQGSRLRGLALLATLAAWQATELKPAQKKELISDSSVLESIRARAAGSTVKELLESSSPH